MVTTKLETKSSIEVPNAQQQVAVAQNDKSVQNGDDQVINLSKFKRN